MCYKATFIEHIAVLVVNHHANRIRRRADIFKRINFTDKVVLNILTIDYVNFAVFVDIRYGKLFFRKRIIGVDNRALNN